MGRWREREHSLDSPSAAPIMQLLIFLFSRTCFPRPVYLRISRLTVSSSLDMLPFSYRRPANIPWGTMAFQSRKNGNMQRCRAAGFPGSLAERCRFCVRRTITVFLSVHHLDHKFRKRARVGDRARGGTRQFESEISERAW